MNLIRNCIIKIESNNDGNKRLNFGQLFVSQNNLYSKIRKMDPFNLGENDKITRLYVNLTIYASLNRPLIYIPWVLEGSLNSRISYDISEFQSEYEYILNENSKKT